MSHTKKLPGADFLNDAGLNLHHVFDLDDLPADMVTDLRPNADERQLLLFGHGGRRLWEYVQARGIHTQNPIDDYSIQIANEWLSRALPTCHVRIVFPGTQRTGLQRLGALAGWHHASPFMIGINVRWGSWFAYRVVMLADTHLPVSVSHDQGHPCVTCKTKFCVRACPVDALSGDNFDLARCNSSRLAADSRCMFSCVARSACPVGAEHRYDDSLIRHSASYSYATISAANRDPVAD